MLNPYQISMPLTCIMSAVLSIFVLVKNPRSQLNRHYAVTVGTVAVWAFLIYHGMFSQSAEASRLWFCVSQLFALLISITYTHFCLVLVGRPARSNKLLWCGYAFAIVLACTMFHPMFIPFVSPKLIFKNYINPGPLYYVFQAVFATFAIYAPVIVWRSFKGSPPSKINQYKYVFVSKLLGFICGSTLFLLVYDIPFDPWPAHFTWVYTWIVAYAILKHRLLDITIVIRKSVIYSILVALITALYLAFVIVLEQLLQDIIGYNTRAPSILATFLIALSFNPLRHWIQSFVDRYFFKGSQAAMAEENALLKQAVERSDRLKTVSILAAGMAHEIKNPLTAIKTFTESLGEKHRDPVFVRKFQRIVGAELTKIHQIVQQVLDFAKPGRPKREPVHIAHLLDETLELLNHDIVGKQVAIQRQYTHNDVVPLDREQMKQVFLNVFLNSLQAIDGTRRGIITVRTAKDNGCICVMVADNGCGIPEDKLPHVFDPFITGRTGGTGLGLSVVHRIVEQHKGALRVTSEMHRSTTVEIELPVDAHD